MSIRRVLLTAAGGWCLASAAGCGGGARLPDLEKQTQVQNSAKVEIAKAIAAAVEKDDKSALTVALEDWRSTPFSPANSPKETEQIIEIYRTRIQPKAKGETATTVEGEMRHVVGKK